MMFRDAHLHNTVSLREHPQGWALSRVSQEVLQAINPHAQESAWITCGSEIRFTLRGKEARITLVRPAYYEAPPAGIAEIYFGPFQAAYQYTPIAVGATPQTITIAYPPQIDELVEIARQHALPFDPRVVRLILPYDAPTILVDIEGDIAPPRREQLPQKTYLAYGSSITHGGSAIRPSETFAMQTAQSLGCDLLNLGFANSAYLDAALASAVASEYEWDIATLELGINVIGHWTVDEFAQAVQAFVPQIAARPDRRVWCIDLLPSHYDVTDPEKVTAFRHSVSHTVAASGLANLRYIDGSQLLRYPQDLTTDLIHPSATGMASIARALVEAIRADRNNGPHRC
ncbi:MAG TPA: GDSL-type esterase/lipase family protein [Ktedonobacteraceae bacterium]|nr:GDSL-type esterase/lipase family protein [Ktedonobacteraceae bacterium]